MKRKDDDFGEANDYEAYKDLIVGSSSEEENNESSSDKGSQGNVSEKEQKRIESMRQKLLGGL